MSKPPKEGDEMQERFVETEAPRATEPRQGGSFMSNGRHGWAGQANGHGTGAGPVVYFTTNQIPVDVCWIWTGEKQGRGQLDAFLRRSRPKIKNVQHAGGGVWAYPSTNLDSGATINLAIWAAGDGRVGDDHNLSDQMVRADGAQAGIVFTAGRLVTADFARSESVT